MSASSAKADCDIWSCTERRRAVRRKVRRHRPEVRYYAAPSRYDDEEFRCKATVRGLGTQWVGEQGALEAARKDWMERTRYDLGEVYVDMSHAIDFKQRCGRTSIGETLGQVLFRCEIWARPCRAEMERTEGRR